MPRAARMGGGLAPLRRRTLAFAWLACALPLLAACAAGAETENNPAHKAARYAGLTTTAPEPKDFVRSARPAVAGDYIPVGITPVVRAVAPRPASSLPDFETALQRDREAARTFSQRDAPARRAATAPPVFPAIPASRGRLDVDPLPGNAETYPVSPGRRPRRVSDP